MLYCRFTCFLLSFVNVFNLNVPYFLSHLLYQNSSLVGHILLTWFYPYQSILLFPSSSLTTFQISSSPELYECLNKLKLLLSKLALWSAAVEFVLGDGRMELSAVLRNT